jgi:hypothetical protein
MGFESFRVELRGARASYREVDETLRGFPHIRLDRDAVLTPRSTCYRRDDGQHVFEIELLDEPVRLSCRFTLCHPASVDSGFLAFVHDLMVRFGMTAKICDDVRAEHAGSFSLKEFATFSAITERSIAVRRAEWIAAFGSAPLAATTNEVHQQLILPRCQPGIGQPT